MLRTAIGLLLGFTVLACSGGDNSGGNPSTNGTSGPGPTVTSGGPMGAGGNGTGTTTGGTGGSGGSGSSTQQLNVNLSGPGKGTVTSTPAGIDCSNVNNAGPCSAAFPTGATVTLTATPSSTSMFGGWTEGCAGNGPCTLSLDSTRSVTASFTQGNALTVNLAGDGSGTVVSDPPGIDCTSGSMQGCTFAFPNDIGNSVSLTVTPAAGSSFAGWSFGGCNGSPYTHTCSVPLSSSGSSVGVSFSAWQTSQPFPSAVAALASFKGSYVAIGSGSAAATSSDGASWTGQILPTKEAMHGIATDGTIAVAVGDHGAILTTTDAASWTAATSGSMASLTGVAFGGGTFVAVGSGGAILWSSNGTSWTASTSTTTYDLLAVTFGGGQFVAVGYGGTILTSPDGRAWTARMSMTTQFLAGVTYGAGRYVAVGSAGAVLTSPEGVTWMPQVTFTTSALRAVAFASGSPAYVASGDATSMSSPSSALVFTSDDGVSWTPRATGAFQEQFTGMANVGGAWLALGNGGSILRSANGTDWAPSLSPGGRGPIGMHDGTSIAAMVYGNGTYVAAGSYGSIFTSPDGKTWTSRAADRVGASNSALAFGSVFVVTQNVQGGSWRILSSADGKTWTERATGSPGSLWGVAYGGASKGFVAVGSSYNGNALTGVVSTSPDGMTWTSRSGTTITSQLTGIAFGADLFAATGLGGSIYTSADGASWTPQASPTTDTLSALTYGNGTFVAIDTQNIGQVSVTSTDGIAWKDHKLSLMLGGALVFGQGKFMSSALHTSTDGVTWTASSGTPENAPLINGGIFTAAVYGPNAWVGGSMFETFLFHP